MIFLLLCVLCDVIKIFVCFCVWGFWDIVMVVDMYLVVVVWYYVVVFFSFFSVCVFMCMLVGFVGN